jgi:hypothetical protein
MLKPKQSTVQFKGNSGTKMSDRLVHSYSMVSSFGCLTFFAFTESVWKAKWMIRRLQKISPDVWSLCCKLKHSGHEYELKFDDVKGDKVLTMTILSTGTN